MSDNLNYEQQIKKLEEIISKLEQSDLPIDEGLKLFEQGANIIKSAEKKLQETKGKLTIIKDGIEKDADN